MNKYLLLFLAIVTVGITGCSKDDEKQTHVSREYTIEVGVGVNNRNIGVETPKMKELEAWLEEGFEKLTTEYGGKFTLESEADSEEAAYKMCDEKAVAEYEARRSNIVEGLNELKQQFDIKKADLPENEKKTASLNNVAGGLLYYNIELEKIILVEDENEVTFTAGGEN